MPTRGFETCIAVLLHSFATTPGRNKNLIMNKILQIGFVPPSWQRTLFQMVLKSHRPHTVADFRPIVIIPFVQKMFAYLILGRIETTLEQHQPEERHSCQNNFTIKYVHFNKHVFWQNTVGRDTFVDWQFWFQQRIRPRTLRFTIDRFARASSLDVTYPACSDQKGQESPQTMNDMKPGLKQGYFLNPTGSYGELAQLF